MSDLISREYMKSLGATCIASRSKDGNMFPIVSIDELPSVQPEIIRCKDCKYAYMTGDGLVKHCDIWFPNEKLYQDGDYYCADAELRGDKYDT